MENFVDERKNGVLSILSLVFGILGLVLEICSLFAETYILGFICAIVAIITGIIAICMKNKIALPIIGIILSVLTIVSGVLIVLGLFIFNKANSAIEDNYKNGGLIDYSDVSANSSQILNSELELEKLSLMYDSSKWKRDTTSDTSNTKALKGQYGSISISLQTTNYYFTLDQIADEVKKLYEERGYEIISYGDLEINGKTWKKISFLAEDLAGMQMICLDRYNIYTFQYMTSSAVYYAAEIKDVSEVYNTLNIDNTEDILSEEEAKDKLIGEWDWGSQGYFVIDENMIYLYKDSSKDINNLIYGTYKADNKIMTYGAGYADGIYVLMTIKDFYIDGERLNDATGSQFEFAFIEGADGTYIIKNINTGASGIAEKIR